jgi:hypothetical protein
MSLRKTHLRAVSLVSVLAIALGAAGCGSSGTSSGDKDYYSSMDTFCSSVKSAANNVRTDAAKLQTNIATNPKTAIQGFAKTLDAFATATETALTKLKAAKVPSKYSDFTTQAITAFSGVVGRLHTAADGARTGSVKALASLGTSLNSVKLPKLPKDVQKNAKACAAISPAA